MARYDIEDFLDDLLAAMQANLNASITAVNSEKNDSITLAAINNDAYFLQSMNERVANFDPFVFYGYVDPQTKGIGGASAHTYTIQVIITMIDRQDSEASKRIFRYGRALEDLFHSKFDKIGQNRIQKITSLEPVPIVLGNSSDLYRAIGVNLEVALTS